MAEAILQSSLRFSEPANFQKAARDFEQQGWTAGRLGGSTDLLKIERKIGNTDFFFQPSFLQQMEPAFQGYPVCTIEVSLVGLRLPEQLRTALTASLVVGRRPSLGNCITTLDSKVQGQSIITIYCDRVSARNPLIDPVKGITDELVILPNEDNSTDMKHRGLNLLAIISEKARNVLMVDRLTRNAAKLVSAHQTGNADFASIAETLFRSIVVVWR